MLEDMIGAFCDRKLRNLMMAPQFAGILKKTVPALREITAAGILRGIPLPEMSSALSFFDGYRCAKLPANLLQAQRDYFGAHTYERIDRPRGEFFHTNWTGQGGDTAATNYNV